MAQRGPAAGERRAQGAGEAHAKPGGDQAGRGGTSGAQEAEWPVRARGLAGVRIQARVGAWIQAVG